MFERGQEPRAKCGQSGRVAFEKLQALEDADPRILKVSRQGIEMIRAEEEAAAERDHHKAVFGS